jgi:hypothetical protein
MAQMSASFRAMRLSVYLNAEKVKGGNRVLCGPVDFRRPDDTRSLFSSSPFNMLAIVEKPGGGDFESKH